MKETYLIMLEADEGMVLVKDGTYSASVLLRKGETSDGWSEITKDEYDEIIKEQIDNAKTIEEVEQIKINYERS